MTIGEKVTLACIAVIVIALIMSIFDATYARYLFLGASAVAVIRLALLYWREL